MSNKLQVVLYVTCIVVAIENFCFADPVSVDVRFCSDARNSLGTLFGVCKTVETCELSLSSVRSSFSNERKENVGPRKCQNNCTSSAGTPDSYSVSQQFTLGHTASELWQNSHTFQIGLGTKPVGGNYQYVTTVGASTGTSVSTSVTVSETFTVSAGAGKKVCKQVYAKLVNFRYEQDYAYKYTRTDTVPGVVCYCYVSPSTGIHDNGCANIISASGTATATGTKSNEVGNDVTETAAVDCDGG
ncbi:MAG: hypothetical protein LBU65_13485 [Planctomycetaceae bacterium]|jgi:hypothetical protein|nr:hypothetical protein [Planctomycetaceae bacterium]